MDLHDACLTCTSSRKRVGATFGTSIQVTILLTFMLCALTPDISHAETCGTLVVTKNNVTAGDSFEFQFNKQSGISLLKWQKHNGTEFRNWTADRNSEEMVGPREHTLDVTNSRESDTGTYRVLCTNGLVSKPAELRVVLAPPTPPLFDRVEDFPGCSQCLKAIPGKLTSVTCTSYNGSDAASMTMYKNMQLLQNLNMFYNLQFRYASAKYIFTPTTADANTEFKCTAKNDAIVTPVESSVRVYLFRAPSAPVTESTEERAGFPVSVKCVTTGGKPAPNMTFIFRNQSWNFPVESIMIPSDGTFSTESVFTVQVTRDDKEFQCCAIYEAVSGNDKLCTTKYLHVEFPPKAVSVTSSRQVSDDLGDTAINLTCALEESNTNCTVQWKGLKHLPSRPITRNNFTGPDGWRYIWDLEVDLTRKDNGRTIACAAVCDNFSDLQLTANFKVNITYSPVISISPGTSLNVYEGDNVTVTCHVDSNPDSSIDWYSNSDIITADAVTKYRNKSYLDITNVTRSHIYVYACAAQNGIGEKKFRHFSLTVLDKSSKPHSSDDSSSNTGAIVGGVVAALLIVALVIVVLLVIVNKKRSNGVENTGRTDMAPGISKGTRKPNDKLPAIGDLTPVGSGYEDGKVRPTSEAEYANIDGDGEITLYMNTDGAKQGNQYAPDGDFNIGQACGTRAEVLDYEVPLQQSQPDDPYITPAGKIKPQTDGVGGLYANLGPLKDDTEHRYSSLQQ